MIYPVLLLSGLLGLVVMAALGFVHGQGPGHHSGHGHGHTGHDALGTQSGHAHDIAGHALPGHAHGTHGHGAALPAPAHSGPAHTHGAPPLAVPGHAHSHGAAGDSNSAADGDADVQQSGTPLVSGLLWLMPLLSPLNWFSWLFGAGLAGVAGGMAGLQDPLLGVLALGGAAIFKMGVVGPIWRLVFGFATRPAGNLEACLMQEVEAITAFNARGEGLVRVNVDGRSEDVLARLVNAETGAGARIPRGERLLIEEVDAARGECRVSRL